MDGLHDYSYNGETFKYGFCENKNCQKPIIITSRFCSSCGHINSNFDEQAFILYYNREIHEQLEDCKTGILHIEFILAYTEEQLLMEKSEFCLFCGCCLLLKERDLSVIQLLKKVRTLSKLAIEIILSHVTRSSGSPER